jgi:branched-chain amino acid transport system permease protein
LEEYLAQLPQQLVNGLTLGGVYALIAIGYTMVYGILGMLNFAHGEVYMIGGFAGWWVLHLLTRGNELLVNAVMVIALMIVIAMAVSGLVGITAERFAYRPLRNAPRMNLLLSALGVSIFLQNLVLHYQGAKVRSFHIAALIPESIRSFHIGTTVFSFMRILVIVITFLLMGLLTLMIKKTKVGKAMRATAQDREMAMLVGVDVNRVISITFIVGSATAALGGVLIASHIGQINFYIGFIAGIKAFVAAVLGGIGSMPGAVLGSLVLGCAESFFTGFVSSDYEDVFAFIILVFILIFRPAGILGRSDTQKV